MPHQTITWFICLLLIGVCTATPLRSFQASIDQKERQEIMTLAARIIRIAMSLSPERAASDKRNAGTVDALYNMPDLFDVGRR